MSGFSQEKFSIPFINPLAKDEIRYPKGRGIVGILATPDKPQKTKRVVVILHGHGGDKNYIYQKELAKQLAAKLGLYTFRFDFRGCGESEDLEYGFRGLDNDMFDLDVVTDYLSNVLDLELAALIGHSVGAVVAFRWALNQQVNGKHVPNIINCAGRYSISNLIKSLREESSDFFFEGRVIKSRRFGKSVTNHISPEEYISLLAFNMDSIKYLREDVSVLTIYGQNDKVVSLEDAALYANTLGEKNTLRIILDADHAFYDTRAVEVSGATSEVTSDADKAVTGRRNHHDLLITYILDFLHPDAERERFVKRNSRAGGVLGPNRWKVVPGMVNLRDFGGYRIANTSDKWVKTGVLFRSGKLNWVEGDAKKLIADLGIKQVFDLRSTIELGRTNPEQNLFNHPGIVTTHTPLFTDKNYSPLALVERYKDYADNGFMKTYSEILQAGARTAFPVVFRWIRDHPGEGILIHCSAGKDRTGVLCALILLLVGVDPITVAHEYELTTIGYEPDRRNILDGARLGIMSEAGKQLSPEGWANLTSSRYDTMIDTIDMITRKFGGVIHYLKYCCGLSDEDLAQIKKNLTVSHQHALRVSKL